MIDLLHVEPNKVSSNITGYAIGIMGAPGVGKTTLASKIPDSLLIATEPGYKAIPGIKAVDVNSWTDFLQVVAQLRKPAVQEIYKVVVIDTLDELVFLAIQHLLQVEGVATLSDIPWGGGYSKLEEMLRKTFRQIQQHYGFFLLAHDGRKSEKDTDDNTVYYAALNFNIKVKRVIMGLLDILAYVDVKRGESEGVMHFRSSEFWEAKSRFANMVESCPFNYESLVKAVQDAVAPFALTDERKTINYEDNSESLPTEAEFEDYLTKVYALATDLIDNHNKGEEVKNAIADNFGQRKLGSAKLEDYYSLVSLEEQLNRLK